MSDQRNLPALRQQWHIDLPSLGKMLASSGYFKDAADEAKAIVKVLAGQELGLGPIASMTGIHIVEGKPALSAALIASLIKRSGKYDYRVLQMDATACRLEFFEGGQAVGVSEFTIADASAAGLAGRPVWKSYPRNMLFARALTNGARWHCAEVFSGAIYTEEELKSGASDAEELSVLAQRPQMVDTATGEILDSAEPTPANDPPPPPDPGNTLFATEAQRKKLFAIARNDLGWGDEDLKRAIRERYALESTKTLTREQMSMFIEYLESQVVIVDGAVDSAT